MKEKTAYEVIALTYNNLDVTKRFVASYVANTDLSSRLIIIDNGSNDGTAKYLSSLRNTNNCIFDIILNKENKGFVRGINQGLSISDAPYVCLANNDLIFTKGWFREIISVFEKYKNIGILNPNSNNLGVHHPKGISLDDFARGLKTKYRGIFVEMPFCIGFCLCVKRDVLDKVGYFSEEFDPMFFEDTDFSIRVKKAGYLIGMAKSAYVWHEEHSSLKKVGDEKKKIFLRSKATFIKKWGRILRLGWVVNDYDELLDSLDDGISLSRKGNFVWFFVKDLRKERYDIFRERHLIEHSGVKFVGFRSSFDLIWKVLKKRKKYDVIIDRNRFTKYIFSKSGNNVLSLLDMDRIARMKSG